VFGNPPTWDDLPWLRSLTSLPLILKGICHSDDARRALDAGADGIYVSNHGDRQANGGLPALADLTPGGTSPRHRPAVIPGQRCLGGDTLRPRPVSAQG